jgi:Icc protein
MISHHDNVHIRTDVQTHSGSCHRLLHLTDLHLFATPEQTLLSQRTRLTFETVMAKVHENHAQFPDAILITGDLVQDNSMEAYQYLRDYFASFKIPIYYLPGNHDCLTQLATVMPNQHVDYPWQIAFGQWDLVLLDSIMPDREGGHLSSHALVMLEQMLMANDHRPVLIALHHHPVPVNSAWLDTMLVDNAAELLAIVDRYPQVRVVLYGHVHQEFTASRKGVVMLATPSTCIQFRPGSYLFAIDDMTPGYRWLDLFADGSVRTGICRIPVYPDPLDWCATGY